MANTIIQQGRFTSDGALHTLEIRSDIDWMRVYNQTAIAQTSTDLGAVYEWRRGFASDIGFIWSKLGNVSSDPVTIAQMASGGFNLVDSSTNPLTSAIAIASSTDLTQPVFSTSDTTGLKTGSIVRLTGITGQENLSGLDFEIDTVVTNTSFKMRFAIATTPGAAGSAGAWRRVQFNPLYYPRRRFIANITAASSAVITTTVQHGFFVGQTIRINVPSVYGMIQMDGLLGTITAAATNSITVDIDSTAFTAFKFPLPAIVPFSPALVVPVGEDTAESLGSTETTLNANNILSDATDNEGFIGMTLGLGVAGDGTNGPSGQNSDVMYWEAGRAFSVTNL